MIENFIQLGNYQDTENIFIYYSFLTFVFTFAGFVLVFIAIGSHLFPFRTEKLSQSAPMILGSQGPWKVGKRWD